MKKRSKLIKRAMRLTWSSLNSHLPHLDGPEAKFHWACVGEYLELLVLLRKLY